MLGRGCGLVIAFVAAFGVTTSVFSQSADRQIEASPFLMLDQERFYQQSLFGIRVSDDIQAQADAFSAENRRIDAALVEEEQRLTDERPNMDPVEFRALAKDFDERVTAIRRAQASKQAAIKRQGDSERARFFEMALPVLVGLVEDTGAVAIMDNNAVIFSVRKIDITDEAIARVNEEIGASTPAPDPGPQPTQRPNIQP